MFVLYQFLFYLYIQNAEAYMGKARMLRKNCTQRQNENEKRTKTTGNRELSQIVLAWTRQRLGGVVLLDELGHPGYRGLATSSKAALVAEELFFRTHVPKIPPARANVYHNPVATSHHEAQAFLEQYTIKPTSNWCCDHPLETGTDARLCLLHGWPRGNNEAPKTA